jgi:hypothetical protein
MDRFRSKQTRKHMSTLPEPMNKSTIEDCLKYFKSIDVDAYQDDDSSVYVHVGFDVYVQISNAEIIFRADEWLNQQG